MFFFGPEKTAGEAPTVSVLKVISHLVKNTLLIFCCNTWLFLWFYLHSSEICMFYVPLGMHYISSSWTKIMIFAVFIFAFIALISLYFKFSKCVILTKLRVIYRVKVIYSIECFCLVLSPFLGCLHLNVICKEMILVSFIYIGNYDVFAHLYIRM